MVIGGPIDDGVHPNWETEESPVTEAGDVNVQQLRAELAGEAARAHNEQSVAEYKERYESERAETRRRQALDHAVSVSREIIVYGQEYMRQQETTEVTLERARRFLGFIEGKIDAKE